MRVTLSVLALGALMMQATPVFAQAAAPSTGGGGLAGSMPVSPAPTGPVSNPNALPSTPGSATATPPGTGPGAGSGAPNATRGSHRQMLDARFAAANTTHDGHLTLEQAQAANWNNVVKNFTAMDKGSKGYVTLADIRGYSKARRAAHKHTPAAPANAQPTSPQ